MDERFTSLNSVIEGLAGLGITIPRNWLLVIANQARDSFRNILIRAVDGDNSQWVALQHIEKALEPKVVECIKTRFKIADELIVSALLQRPVKAGSAFQIACDAANAKHQEVIAWLETLFAALDPHSQPTMAETKAGQIPSVATDSETEEAVGKSYKSRHVYGSSFGLCFNLSSYRGKAGVMVDAAVAIGPDNYDWNDAIHIWLNEMEIAACLAVLRKWQPRIELNNHGPRRDKSLVMESQGAKVFIKVGERSRKQHGLRAVQMLPGQTTAVAIFMMDALKECYPGVPLMEIVETIRANFEHPKVVNG